jgi:hypothetical protein
MRDGGLVQVCKACFRRRLDIWNRGLDSKLALCPDGEEGGIGVLFGRRGPRSVDRLLRVRLRARVYGSSPCVPE